MSDFYDISVTLADGTTTTMGGWAGHVLLIANRTVYRLRPPRLLRPRHL